MSAQTQPKPGTWTFTCRNHPTYRWTKTKCGPGFMGRGVLLFQGDLATGKPSSAINFSESTLAGRPADYQAHYRSKYAVECDCPIEDLIVVAHEYQPFPAAE